MKCPCSINERIQIQSVLRSSAGGCEINATAYGAFVLERPGMHGSGRRGRVLQQCGRMKAPASPSIMRAAAAFIAGAGLGSPYADDRPCTSCYMPLADGRLNLNAGMRSTTWTKRPKPVPCLQVPHSIRNLHNSIGKEAIQCVSRGPHTGCPTTVASALDTSDKPGEGSKHHISDSCMTHHSGRCKAPGPPADSGANKVEAVRTIYLIS